MDAEAKGLTLEMLAHRLEALERENAELRSKVAALKGSDNRCDEVRVPRGSEIRRPQEEPSSEPSGELEGRRISRRLLLGRAGAAAAGLVVAGALTQRDIREAKAADPFSVTTNTSKRGAVEGTNENAEGYGVWGNANYIGVRGTGFLGVSGEGSHTGVLAISDPGSTTNQGAGIQASHKSQGPGVLADSEGGPAVQARSFGGTSGAVYGKHSAQGYGGLFEGGKAQLRLVPGSGTGRPGGTHSKGELYMDSNAALFVCVKGGTPGTWRKVATAKA